MQAMIKGSSLSNVCRTPAGGGDGRDATLFETLHLTIQP